MLTVNPLPLQGNVQSEGFGIDNIFAVKILVSHSRHVPVVPLEVLRGKIGFNIEVRNVDGAEEDDESS